MPYLTPTHSLFFYTRKLTKFSYVFFLIVTPFIKKTVTGWELMTLYDLLPFPGRFVLEDSCEEKKKG